MLQTIQSTLAKGGWAMGTWFVVGVVTIATCSVQELHPQHVTTPIFGTHQNIPPPTFGSGLHRITKPWKRPLLL